MSADTLLARLDGVKKTGAARWIARCAAHDDRSPSLSVREIDDGRVLVHCFGGCAVEDVLSAVGLEFDSLYPEKARDHQIKGARRPWLPAEVFAVARMEISVVAIIGSDMHAGRTVSDADYERLYVAVNRLNGIAETAYGRS